MADLFSFSLERVKRPREDPKVADLDTLSHAHLWTLASCEILKDNASSTVPEKPTVASSESDEDVSDDDLDINVLCDPFEKNATVI